MLEQFQIVQEVTTKAFLITDLVQTTVLQLSLDLAFKRIAAAHACAAMPLPSCRPIVLTTTMGLLLLVVARVFLVVVKAWRQWHRCRVLVRVASQIRIETVLVILGGPDSLGKHRGQLVGVRGTRLSRTQTFQLLLRPTIQLILETARWETTPGNLVLSVIILAVLLVVIVVSPMVVLITNSSLLTMHKKVAIIPVFDEGLRVARRGCLSLRLAALDQG